MSLRTFIWPRLPITIALFAISLPDGTGATTAASTPAGGPAATAPAQTSKEVNVATAARGAKVVATAAAPGLDALIAGASQATALLRPNPSTGASVNIIDLAQAVDIKRVALSVGAQRGTLTVIGLTDPAVAVDAVAAGPENVLGRYELTGATSSVVAAANAKVRALMVVWVPANPGEALVVSSLGVFAEAEAPGAGLPAAGQAGSQPTPAGAGNGATPLVPGGATPPATTPPVILPKTRAVSL